MLWNVKPCSGVERRAVLLREDVLGASAVLAGEQNCRDGPMAAEMMLFLLRKRAKEPFLQDGLKLPREKLF